MTVNLSLLAGAGWQFSDNNGSPLSGGLLYTYAAGTTTPQATYTSNSGVTAHTNPIVLDSAGRIASGGEIWLTQGQNYKFVLKTSVAVTLGTYDNISGASDPANIYAALAAPSGSSLVGYQPAGTGAVATTVQTKLRESVSVLDFGADATGVADSTTAFTNAQTASKNVIVPPGTYLLNNLRIQTGVNLIGSGHINTVFIQKTAGNPAINCTSDASVGQLNGLIIKDFSITGATGATVSAFLIAAYGVYAIGDSIFDFRVTNSFRALEVQAADANNLVGSSVSVVSSNTSSTSVVINGGVYNKYNLFMTGCASGLALTAYSWNSIYSQVVAEGALYFNGQQDLILNPSIEQFSAAVIPTNIAIELEGFRQTLINPTILLNPTNSAKVSYAISTFGETTLVSPQLLCTIANPLQIQSGNYATIIGPVTSSCTNKVESLYDPRLTTFLGDCSQITTSNTPRSGQNIQYSAPNNVTWGLNTLSNTDICVLESSVGTITTLNLKMPVAYNNQTFTVSSTTAITTISTTAGTVGDNVSLVPASLAAGASFTMVYRAANTKWYKA